MHLHHLALHFRQYGIGAAQLGQRQLREHHGQGAKRAEVARARVCPGNRQVSRMATATSTSSNGGSGQHNGAIATKVISATPTPTGWKRDGAAIFSPAANVSADATAANPAKPCATTGRPRYRS